MNAMDASGDWEMLLKQKNHEKTAARDRCHPLLLFEIVKIAATEICGAMPDAAILKIPR